LFFWVIPVAKSTVKGFSSSLSGTLPCKIRFLIFFSETAHLMVLFSVMLNPLSMASMVQNNFSKDLEGNFGPALVFL
jgi:hypothetical protein